MTTSQVQVTIDVKSEQFHQKLEETIVDSSSLLYDGLISANERLKSNISKILTEFVNKARLEQGTDAEKKKRKLENDDDDENEDEPEDEDEDAASSDNNEEEQE
ncbi:unnamed protein product [Adineta ricciae]|uniref:Uncharacterized protein n=1 Tax=Adineta ricciae TaxID=249248 RepID=A0A815CZK8_ADIRI|nr:unnamed protein product [Adineta ricciae]